MSHLLQILFGGATVAYILIQGLGMRPVSVVPEIRQEEGSV